MIVLYTDTFIQGIPEPYSTPNVLSIGMIVGSTLGGVACLCIVVISMLIVFLCVRRKQRNRGRVHSQDNGYLPKNVFINTDIIFIFFLLALKTDHNGSAARGKPKKKKPRSLALKMEANNPLYEGPVYEVTPGESLKSLMSPGSTPSTPLSDLTPRYFDLNIPPSIPPPRNGSSLCTRPKLETLDEIDTIKASFDKGEVSQQGEEYMIMGIVPKDGGNICIKSQKDESNQEDAYATLK